MEKNDWKVMMVVGKREGSYDKKQTKSENKVCNIYSRLCGQRLKHSPKPIEQQYRRPMALEITQLLLFSLFLAIFIVFTVPLTGALVRLRANYNPKGLQLDPEDGVQPHTGPVITSFFVMLSRVRQLEVSGVPHELLIGWPGSWYQ